MLGGNCVHARVGPTPAGCPTRGDSFTAARSVPWLRQRSPRRIEDATAVLDVVELATAGDGGHPPPGRRGRKHDPLYNIRNALRAGAEKFTAESPAVSATRPTIDSGLILARTTYRHTTPMSRFAKAVSSLDTASRSW